jgi:MoaA/NifB/PqqE/SkfB family radical SAM enzyme
MYNLSDIRTIHFEPTNKCQARCPQCGRINQNNVESKDFFKINPLITDRNGKSGCLDEISLIDFIKWFPPRFIHQLNYFYMCGTSGEPSLATDCLKIFAYLRHINPRIKLTIHTNGGCKSKEWWEKLAKLRVESVFGIDGLEDTHALYRVNTDWKKIIDNASAFIEAGGEATWQMLVFKHNQHQIIECAKMAKDMGFKSFNYFHTIRFSENDDISKQPVYNPKGEVTHYLEPSSITLKNYQKMRSSFNNIQSKNEVIDCLVKREKSLYVAANGNVLPCCHMVSCFEFLQDDMDDYKNKIGVKYNLYQNTLVEIFDSMYFKNIEKTWSKDPLLACAKTCGKTTGTWFDNTKSQSIFINF